MARRPHRGQGSTVAPGGIVAGSQGILAGMGAIVTGSASAGEPWVV